MLDELTTEQRQYLAELVQAQEGGAFRREMYYSPAFGFPQGVMCDPKERGSQEYFAEGITTSDLETLRQEGYINLDRDPGGSIAVGLKQKAFREIAAVKNQSSRAIPAPGTRVFIGHGRNPLWLEVQRFLEKQLHLDTDDFNREPTAGVLTGERLEQMLDDSCFAFIVMTGDDIRANGKMHARDNVIHEIGLFQGRLGRRRAIILLEDGCEGFSNIDGLTYIGFPSGKISAAFQEVREVLEREKIIAPTVTPTQLN